MSTPNPIEWREEFLYLLDQRVLPHKEEWHKIDTIEKCHWSIVEMVVRGAPCIGFTGIFGMALALKEMSKIDEKNIIRTAEYLNSARPTAVNLKYELDRCVDLILKHDDPSIAYLEIVKFGLEQIESLKQKNTKMAELALNELDKSLKKNKYNFMTHCNTGFLACGCIGTALGVISHAHSKGKVNHTYADETRPYLQGSRLTAYELQKEGIPHSIVVEGAASHLLKGGNVDAIFVGADRIARNGDTANKIGTSTLAIVAKYYKIPFYVVAPLSSFDINIDSGAQIPIELRPDTEIKEIQGVKISPVESKGWNPSFDVTDSTLITGIICENGIIKPPYNDNLIKVVRNENSNN